MTHGSVTIDIPRVGPLEPEPNRPRRRVRLSRLGVVGLVLIGALGFLIDKAVTSAVVYFKTASQALAARSSLGDTTFQIEGLVVPGSLDKRRDGTVAHFWISSGKARVYVENSAPEPALFQQDIPVVLVGHFLGTSDTFASDQILVKHSNQYIAAHPGRVRAPNGSVR